MAFLPKRKRRFQFFNTGLIYHNLAGMDRVPEAVQLYRTHWSQQTSYGLQSGETTPRDRSSCQADSAEMAGRRRQGQERGSWHLLRLGE